MPTPIVRLNRAVAVGFAQGPQAGLELVDELGSALPDYHLLPSVRGDLLRRLGRPAEARAELTRAAALTRNDAERDFLLGRAAALDLPPDSARRWARRSTNSWPAPRFRPRPPGPTGKPFFAYGVGWVTGRRWPT